MLTALSIRNVVLVDRLDLDFTSGLTVLTGETGAGKSILLDALGLALGQRAESGLVGAGADAATVTAEFDPPPGHDVWGLIREQGLEAEGSIVLRRQLNGDGKSRAFLNDQPVGIGLLRRIGALLVEIEGQFEAHGLLDAATHRELLDEFAELDPRLRDCAFAHRAWRGADRELSETRERRAQAERDADYLRHALGELDLLDPKEPEEEQLASERALLSNREQIREALAEALADLAGDRGAERTLAASQRRLMRLGDKMGADGASALAALERASIELTEGLGVLRDIERALEADPGRLQKIEDRLFALRDLARKHRVPVRELARLHEKMQADVAALEDSDHRLKELEQNAAKAREAYVEVAGGLSAARAKAALALERSVNRELPPLKLAQAKVRLALEKLDEPSWSEAGWDRVAIEVSTNPGQTPGPIQRVASGGELSRLMLALKLALSKAQPVATLVFDEVDSGIGGATASAVGERLKRLSRQVQLLVVTHSPQVAALGDRHWRVDKIVAAGGARTRVAILDQRQRKEEIARMLSGASVTDEARAAAGKLLLATE